MIHSFLNQIKHHGSLQLDYVRELFLMNKPGIPSDFEMEITYKCNLSCPMCYQGNHRKFVYDEKDLSYEEIKELLLKISPKTILLTGGEATFRPDFFRILDTLQNIGSSVNLLTNGLAFNDIFIDKIRKYECISMINLSLDYFSEKKHDSFRGRKGTYKNIMNAIKQLHGTFKITVCSVLMEDNLDDVKQIISHFAEKNIRVAVLPYGFLDATEVEHTKKEVNVTFGDSPLIYQESNSSIHLKDNLKDIQFYSKAFSNVVFYPSEKHNLFYEGTNQNGYCRYLANKKMRINSKGEVIFCEKIPIVMGNLKEQNVEEIWNTPLFKQGREKVLQGNGFLICKRCPKFRSKQ